MHTNLLGNQLIQNIFSFLDKNDLESVSYVNKEWRAFVTEKDFLNYYIDTHPKTQPMDIQKGDRKRKFTEEVKKEGCKRIKKGPQFSFENPQNKLLLDTLRAAYTTQKNNNNFATTPEDNEEPAGESLPNTPALSMQIKINIKDMITKKDYPWVHNPEGSSAFVPDNCELAIVINNLNLIDTSVVCSITDPNGAPIPNGMAKSSELNPNEEKVERIFFASIANSPLSLRALCTPLPLSIGSPLFYNLFTINVTPNPTPKAPANPEGDDSNEPDPGNDTQASQIIENF